MSGINTGRGGGGATTGETTARRGQTGGGDGTDTMTTHPLSGQTRTSTRTGRRTDIRLNQVESLLLPTLLSLHRPREPLGRSEAVRAAHRMSDEMEEGEVKEGIPNKVRQNRRWGWVESQLTHLTIIHVCVWMPAMSVFRQTGGLGDYRRGDQQTHW